MARGTPRASARRDLLVAGHINVDHFLTLQEFPDHDRTVPIESERRLLGGTASNIARVAASYGVETGLVSRVGGNFPAAFHRALRRSKVDLSGVSVDPGRPTPTCFILVDRSHAQRTLIEQGPMSAPKAADAPSALVAGYSWLHVTTGAPDWQLALADAARRSGTFVAADPAQEVHYRWDGPRLRRLLDRSEILFGNHHEVARAAELAGVPSVARLTERVPLVIETRGDRGARAHSRAGTIDVPPAKVRRVASLIGAGDAFRAGFYAAWFAGQELRACLVAGTRAAALWIEGRSVPIVADPWGRSR